nr:hypothetical protein [Tanacetum cinerariifolium]
MVGYKIAHFKVAELKVEALQVKYPIIDWENYFEGSRTYWKIIRVGSITQAYRSFEDMLKDFDRKDLDALWRIKKRKKDYLLTDVVLLPMLSTKLQVDKDYEMDIDLVMKIFMEANKPKSRRRLLLLVEELVLLVHIDAVRENDDAAEEIKKLL